MPSGFWAKAPINRPQNTISPFILNFLSFKMSFFQRDSNSLIYVYRFSVFLKHLCNCSNLSFDEKRILEGSKWYGLIVRKTVLNAIISHKTFAMIFHLRWKQVDDFLSGCLNSYQVFQLVVKPYPVQYILNYSKRIELGTLKDC